MRIIATLFLILLISSQSVLAKTKEIPAALFAKSTEFYDVKLSPNGTYMGVKSIVEGKSILLIFDRKTMSAISVVRFGTNQQVGNYHWVNDERVVTQITYVHGWDNEPRYHGELFGVNADGSKERYLMGYDAANKTGTRINKNNDAINGTSYVLDPLVDSPKHMLATVEPWTTNLETYVDVYRVNVYTGNRKKVTTAPVVAAAYLTDAEGEARFAISTANAQVSKPHYIPKGESDWVSLSAELRDYADVMPVAFSLDGNSVFLSASHKGGPKGLYKFELSTSEITTVSLDDTGSFSNIWLSRKSRDIYAVEYEVGYPSYEFVNNDNKLAKRLKSFLKALAGHQVRIADSTVDDSVQVIWAGNDRNPGDYYMYDESNRKLVHLFSQKSWLNPDEMADVKPIKYQSRDGMTIHGYLTLPLNSKDKKSPLIVLPHGGPHNERDWWSFDPLAQLLASRGYAVLNVNFRGSEGYGNAFEIAGYGNWGGAVQHDIIDGVKHVLGTQPLDAQNVCILGGSFGGYSALQSSIMEPGMFKCAIGVAGIYDLSLMYKEGDIQASDSGLSYLRRVIGEDENKLTAFSPVNHIAKLAAPVLIIHGEEDERAPVEHAERLVKQLKKHDKEYEYLEFDTEGHGFYKSEHTLEYYNKVLEFLAKHIKK